jgi:hypothetical protein
MTITPTHCPAELNAGALPSTGTRSEYGDRFAAAQTFVAGPPVPYVTPRTGEDLVPRSWFTARPGGLGVAYRHERPDDRDKYGVLWWRTAPPDTRARAQFRLVNPYRQRDTMLGLRCQVCTGEPSRTSRGTLFLHKRTPNADKRWWPNGERTLHPPVCLPCVQKALEYCPFAPEATAIRVKKPRVWGVFGTAFVPDLSGALRPLPQDAECRYGDVKHRRWVVAQQAILELDRCTIVDLRDELAAAGLEPPMSLTA